MKTVRPFLAALLAVSFFSTPCAFSGDAPPPPFPNEAYFKKTAEDRTALIEALNVLSKKGSVGEFGDAIYGVIDSFTGDPSTVLEGCVESLHAENVQIRLTAAEAFLSAGFRERQAIDSLTEVMELPEKQKVYLQGKLTDVRVYAARVLGAHGVTDAADKIWERYQADPDDKLLFSLAEMGDRRPLEVITPLLEKPAKVIRYADILGRLKVTTARQKLESAPSTALEGFKAKRALYWMTGEEKYLDELIASYEQGSLGYLMSIKSPKVEALMKRLVRSQKQQFAEAAMLTLALNYPGSSEVRDAVIDYLKGNTLAVQISAATVYRVGARLKDPEVDKLGEAIDTKAQESRWLHYALRRNMPLDDPRMHLE